MSLPAPPDDPVEREFGSLARKLRAARGFCFVVLFVEDPRASRELRIRLGAMLDKEGRRLELIDPPSPGVFVIYTIGSIFEVARDARADALRPVVWVEAFRDGGDATWDAERRMFLMRLNERRSRLESELAAPLILLLPFKGQHDAASYAPDLWHVRLHSAPLTWAPAESPSRGTLNPSARLAASGASMQTVPKEVTYWEAQLAAALRDSAEDDQALDSLPLHDGFMAVQSWLGIDRPDRAAELAARLVAIAGHRVDSAASATAIDPSLAMQELGIALREQGNALVRAGQADAAAAALQDGIAVARAAIDADNAIPAATHLLSALLSRLGDVELIRRRPREAQIAYRESLTLQRRLPLPGSGSGEVQGFASAVVLGKLGDAALSSNDLPVAIAAYRESIELWKFLRTADANDPDLVRSLALALTRLADAEWDDGQGERALSAYRESASLLRQLQSRERSDPQRLGELAAVLSRIGHVEQASGRVDAAAAACDEALDLCVRARSLGGDIGGLLTDLAGPLQRLAQDASVDMRRELEAFDAEFATFATSFPDSPGPSPDPTALLAAAQRLLAALRGSRAAPK